MSSNSEAARASIAATANEIAVAEASFAARGVDVTDFEDRAEALDIINRIERRMLANMPAPVQEAVG